MKKAMAVLVLAFAAATAHAKVFNFTNANLVIDVPAGWEVTSDAQGMVATPTNGDSFYVVVKAWGPVSTNQLPQLLQKSLDGVFGDVFYGEEGENTVGGMDSWYAFFSATVQGAPVAAMVSVIDAGTGYDLFMTFGTTDVIDKYSDYVETIYNGLKPLKPVNAASEVQPQIAPSR